VFACVCSPALPFEVATTNGWHAETSVAAAMSAQSLNFGMVYISKYMTLGKNNDFNLFMLGVSMNPFDVYKQD